MTDTTTASCGRARACIARTAFSPACVRAGRALRPRPAAGADGDLAELRSECVTRLIRRDNPLGVEMFRRLPRMSALDYRLLHHAIDVDSPCYERTAAGSAAERVKPPMPWDMISGPGLPCIRIVSSAESNPVSAYYRAARC
jgi:hypothetical protein